MMEELIEKIASEFTESASLKDLEYYYFEGHLSYLQSMTGNDLEEYIKDFCPKHLKAYEGIK